MAKYLDPKVDFLFKKIFGEHKELLISFLNSLLPLEEEQEILTIEYLSLEQLKDTPLGKNSIVDVRCFDNFGRAFIVEMQNEWSDLFMKRLLVSGAKTIYTQMNKKDINDKAKNFLDLKDAYVLSVVNDSFSKKKEWYHRFKITDVKDSDLHIEGLEYILLELPNFTPQTWTFTHKKLAVLWLRFLKEVEDYYDTLPEELVSNKLICCAIQMCEEAAMSPAEREAYERSKEQQQWDSSIKELENEVKESKKIIADSKKTIKNKDKTIKNKDKTIEEKDKTIEEKDKSLAEKDKSLAEKDKEIEELKKLLNSSTK